MNELRTGYSEASNLVVCALGRTIHTALTTEPGATYFPTPSPPMAVFLTAIEDFEDVEALPDNPTNTEARKASRTLVIGMIQRLAAGLELTADGDLVKLAATGFPLNRKPVRSTGPLPAPENLRVKPTGIAGQAGLKCRAVLLADNYEAQHTLDPLLGPWISVPAVSNSQNILLTGLERGKDYYFRLRANGANGPSGWSDVATMMVV